MTHDIHHLTAQQLTTLQGEYISIAKEFSDKARLLQPHIDKAHRMTRTNELQSKLADITAQGRDGFDGRDIVILINRSKDMGEGFSQFIGASVTAASELKAVIDECVNTGDSKNTKISANFWSSGSTTAVKFGDIGSLEAMITKAASGEGRDLLPAVKEILSLNTPDRASDKPRHYIIIAPPTLSDDMTASAGILSAAVQLNPKMTLDVIICGTAVGATKNSVLDMTGLVVPNVRAQLAATPADVAKALTTVLAERVAKIAGVVPPAPQPAPQPEAPKAADPTPVAQ